MAIQITRGPFQKTLAIQFKYFGDAVLITPSLRALKESQPDGELHVLLPAEIAPLLEHVPWITKVWALPRTRGRARFRDSWPIIRGLRREHFDRSIDFGGNDRGAIFSLLCGAPRRLGAVDRRNLVKKLGYTQVVAAQTLPLQLVQRHLSLLSAWQIPPPQSLAVEIAADPALADEAARLLPSGRTLCHLSTSQVRKEWPLARWREFYHLARAAGWPLAFSSGTSDRERALLADLKKLEPEIFALPALPSLKLFIAVLQRARALVVGDTGPLHFAAGLGVPVIGLFGADVSLAQVAGIYADRHIIKSTEFLPPGTPLSTDTNDPHSALECIPADRVFAALTAIVPAD